MAADPVNDALRMAECGLAVAAVALPVGLLGYLLARKRGDRLGPRWKPWRVPWGGLEVVAAFAVVFVAIPGVVGEALATSGLYQQAYGPGFPTRPPPAVEAQAAAAGGPAAAAARDPLFVLATVRELWAGLVALPVQFALLVGTARLLYPTWRPTTPGRELPSRLALVALAWLLLTPVVMFVHVAVLSAFDALGWTPDEHPLAKLGSRPVLDRVLFALRACVAAPLVEEVLFRGLLLPWVLGRRWRAWSTLGLTVVVAVVSARQPGEGVEVLLRGPVLFAIGLLLGWVVLSMALRRKRRTGEAVYASAALFAVVHSGVWPTPVPLFVLGLGLGYLAVRTRGFLVPAAVHGLFNAMSVLFVLSSPG